MNFINQEIPIEKWEADKRLIKISTRISFPGDYRPNKWLVMYPVITMWTR